MDEKKRPEGYEKLPARFRSYISNIEGELASLKKRMPVDGKTRVAVVGWRGDSIYLPDDAKVEFTLTDGNEIRVEMDDRERGGQLRIHGIQPLIAIPEVSNGLRIASYHYVPGTGRRAK